LMLDVSSLPLHLTLTKEAESSSGAPGLPARGEVVGLDSVKPAATTQRAPTPDKAACRLWFMTRKMSCDLRST
jgi:hypothetical protein